MIINFEQLLFHGLCFSHLYFWGERKCSRPKNEFRWTYFFLFASEIQQQDNDYKRNAMKTWYLLNKKLGTTEMRQESGKEKNVQHGITIIVNIIARTRQAASRYEVTLSIEEQYNTYLYDILHICCPFFIFFFLFIRNKFDRSFRPFRHHN